MHHLLVSVGFMIPKPLCWRIPSQCVEPEVYDVRDMGHMSFQPTIRLNQWVPFPQVNKGILKIFEYLRPRTMAS